MTTKTQKTMMSTTIAFFLALLLSTTNIAVAGLDPVVLNDLDGEIGKTMPPVDLKSQNAIHHPANEHRGEVPKILQKSKKEIIPHEEGVRFLEENANDPNVVALPSGVQYKILRHGLGMYHPLPFSLCKIHYEGHSRDGEKFDSSYSRDRVVKTRPDHLVKGLEEVMQLMVEGDLWEIYVPAEHGYGSYQSVAHDGLDHTDVIIYKIWLVEITGKKIDAIDRCDILTLKGCTGQIKEFIESATQRYRTLDRMKIQRNRLERQMQTGTGTAEMKFWLHNKIHILDVLLQDMENRTGDEL